MRALFDVFIAAFLLTAAIGSLLALAALWRTVGTDWRPVPPDHPSALRTGGLVAAAWLLIAGALVVAQPWGPMTGFYVLSVGGGLAIVASLLAAATRAARDIHRARTDPPATPSPDRTPPPRPPRIVGPPRTS